MRPIAPFVLAALIAAACGGERPAATVQFVQPTPTPAATLGQPTPTPEPPEVVLSTTEVYQGGAVLVSLTGPAQSGSVSFRGREIPLIQGDHSIFAFVPVATADAPGTSFLTVDFVLANGSEGQFVADVTVLETTWAVDEVSFTDEQEMLLDPAVVAKEDETLTGIYGVFTRKKLWSDLWQFPVLGGITAPFGEQRAVNGGDPAGHHSGTDFGAEEGTKVVATNSGTVVLAREMNLRGNTVIIDHGGGVFSTYAHLSSIVVQEGQRLDPGALIGLVGNTGLSTGAHLHWEMSASGVLVDAVRFADGSNGF